MELYRQHQNRQGKPSVPPQYHALTVFAITVQTVPSVGITVLEKWTNRVLCARTAGIMTEKVWICGGANVTGIKSRIGMQKSGEVNLK